MKKLTGSRVVFLYIAIVIISIVSIVSGLSMYRSIETLLVEEKGKKALSISVAVATLVEENYSTFKAFLDSANYNKENYDTVYYSKMQKIFREIREKTGVKFLYCGTRISNKEMIYLFDGEDPESELFSPLGSKDDLDEIELRIYEEMKPDYTPVINDSVWGELLTGVTPVIDPTSGLPVAHIGVDVSAEQIECSLAGIKKLILFNTILFIVISSLIIYKLLSTNKFFMEYDYLTGLHSKGYEEKFLEQLIKKSTISGKSFPLIMIDFDDFKEINDKYGHHFGDTVLKRVADIIKITTRSVDCCARYGGDEFVIIFPEASLEYAGFACQWLLKEIQMLHLQTINNEDVVVSISIGIALWDGRMTSEQVLEHADKALYLSKRSGKGKMVVYTDDLE